MLNRILGSFVFFLGLLFLSSAFAGTIDEKSPDTILAKVKSVYQSLEIYKAHGTARMDMGSVKIDTDFNILLKKPNLYLVTWTQKLPAGGMAQSGAVWR